MSGPTEQDWQDARALTMAILSGDELATEVVLGHDFDADAVACIAAAAAGAALTFAARTCRTDHQRLLLQLDLALAVERVTAPQVVDVKVKGDGTVVLQPGSHAATADALAFAKAALDGMVSTALEPREPGGGVPEG
jgi:hypothetical protein